MDRAYGYSNDFDCDLDNLLWYLMLRPIVTPYVGFNTAYCCYNQNIWGQGWGLGGNPPRPNVEPPLPSPQSTIAGFHPISIHQMAPLERGSRHLITTDYLIIDLERMKGSLVGWPVADGLPNPHKWSKWSPVSCRIGKVRQPTFYHCATQPTTRCFHLKLHILLHFTGFCYLFYFKSLLINRYEFIMYHRILLRYISVFTFVLYNYPTCDPKVLRWYNGYALCSHLTGGSAILVISQLPALKHHWTRGRTNGT